VELAARRRRARGAAAGRGPGIEDREREPVVGEAVTVAARDAGDQPVDPKPRQVVAGLVHRVDRTADQSGHQGDVADYRVHRHRHRRGVQRNELDDAGVAGPR